MTRPRRDAPRPPEPTDSDGGEDPALVVCIEEYADRVECTFFPHDPDEDALLTTWLTATDGAFVDLDEWR